MKRLGIVFLAFLISIPFLLYSSLCYGSNDSSINKLAVKDFQWHSDNIGSFSIVNNLKKSVVYAEVALTFLSNKSEPIHTEYYTFGTRDEKLIAAIVGHDNWDVIEKSDDYKKYSEHEKTLSRLGILI